MMFSYKQYYLNIIAGWRIGEVCPCVGVEGEGIQLLLPVYGISS